ncbi:TPA: hypothetical protein ACU94S_001993 [Klebsiella aerogenes]|nr:hypothetical protein [Klebsiella aerogenes]
MTDITRLLASLKRRSAHAKEFGHDVLFVKLEDIDALVEALEKAQEVMNAVVTAAAIRGVRPFDGIDCDPPTLEENAEACGDAMSARIRELEANPPKPHHNGLMQISNELASAKQRIAELESRTVTVKLPELCVGVVQGGHAVMVPYAAGHWFNKTAILEMLNAEGIKWEAD